MVKIIFPYYNRVIISRAAEESMIKRAHESFINLNAKNVCGDNWPKSN